MKNSDQAQNVTSSLILTPIIQLFKVNNNLGDVSQKEPSIKEQQSIKTQLDGIENQTKDIPDTTPKVTKV